MEDSYEIEYFFKNETFFVTAAEHFHSRMTIDEEFKNDYFQRAQLVEGTDNQEEGLKTVTPFAWDKKATMFLINQYKERKEKFRDPKIKKKILWNEIKEKFSEIGYSVTEELLDRKWRNLKKTYTSIKDNIKTTGRGRISWEYYDDFSDIYLLDKTVNLPLLLCSFDENENVLTNGNKTESPSALEKNVLPLTTSKTVETISSPEAVTPKHNVRLKDGEATRKSRSGLYYLRKKNLDIEEKRVQEICLLRLALEKSNEIQAERNNIIKELVTQNRRNDFLENSG